MNFLASFLLVATCMSGGESEVKMLLFTSDHCPACETVKPGVKVLLAKGYPIEQINISESRSIADRFRITKVPTFVLVRGSEELARHSGAMTPHEIARQINDATPVRNEPKTSTRETAAGDGYSQPIYPVEQPLPTPSQGSYSSGTIVEGLPTGSVQQGTIISAAPVGPSRVEATPVTSAPVKPVSSVSGHSSANRKSDATSRAKGGNNLTTLKNLEERALRATVRFRIEDDEGTNHGSGTIIHVHNNEALVLTCGHIFRESEGTGKVFADVGFPDNQRTVRGKLLAYDAGERDIALVVIQLDIPIQPVPIAHSDMQPYAGNPLFSFGCDRGKDPTVRRGKMMRVSVYSGVKKYDVSNRPIDGRSGGGLFSAQGELIGVCNAADVNADEGIYAGLDTVHWQIAEASLSEVLRMPSRGIDQDSDETDRAMLANADSHYGKVAENILTAPARRAGNRTIADVRNTSAKVDDLVPVTRAIDAMEKSEGDVEMIIIVRSKTNPAHTNSFVLNNPDPSLINMVAKERLREEQSNTERVAEENSAAPKSRVARLEDQQMRNKNLK